LGSKVASSTSRKLLAQGKKTEDVSSITGYSRNWIYCVVRRYNSSGIARVEARRRGNYGTNSILDDLELAKLWQALQGEASDGGLWNDAKVADCLSKWKEEPVHRQRGWKIGVAHLWYDTGR
jgi:transposase